MDGNGNTLDRRKLLKTGAGLAAAFGGAAVLQACGVDSSTTGGSSTSAGPVQRGGTLTIGQIGGGNAETLNAPLGNSGPDFLRVTQFSEPLWIYRGDKLQVENLLAESEELNEDATLLTVHLRRGVTFHNGKPFTADDVLWTLKQWQKEPTLSLVNGFIDFKGVKKRDKYTVEIPLTKPVADFPSIAASSLGTTMLPVGETYEGNKHIGTGPYKLESFEPGRAEFSANKDYWAGAPLLDGLVSNSSFTTSEPLYNALLAGTVDVIGPLPLELAKTAESAGVQVLTSPNAGNLAIATRVDVPPFNDPRVIQALKYVEDREAIKQSVFNEFGTIGTDLGMAGVPYFASDLKRPHDPEKAKALLKEAGADGLSTEVFTSSIYQGSNQLATIYSEQAKAAGINIKVNQIDPSQYFLTEGKNPWLERPMGVNSWNPVTLSGYYQLALFAEAPYNETHWGNESADKLLFEAIGEQDPGKAEDLWHEVQKMQFEEGGFLIPVNQTWVSAAGQNVNGLRQTPAGSELNWYDFTKAWLSS